MVEGSGLVLSREFAEEFVVSWDVGFPVRISVFDDMKYPDTRIASVGFAALERRWNFVRHTSTFYGHTTPS